MSGVFEPNPTQTASTSGGSDHRVELELGSFVGASVVQLVAGEACEPTAVVTSLHDADVTVTDKRIVAVDGDFQWPWLISELEEVNHSKTEPWTLLVVPDIGDFGIAVRPDDVVAFRRVLDTLPGIRVRHQSGVHPVQTDQVVPSAVVPSKKRAPRPGRRARESALLMR